MLMLMLMLLLLMMIRSWAGLEVLGLRA